MKKVLLQFLGLALLFVAVFSLLNLIDFMTIFEVKKLQKTNEEKLGELFEEVFKNDVSSIHNITVRDGMEAIKEQICKNNDIDPSTIHLHILKKDEMNAFAFPGRNLIVYSSLITSCEKPEELAGVMAHEIAHIEHKHVMKKMVKEFGLSAIISMSTGNKVGGEVLQQVMHKLSSSAYDRTLETDADMTAVKYLQNSHINPEPLADFLYRISEEGNDMPKALEWISTHPNSEERAKEILSEAKRKSVKPRPVMDSTEWSTLQEKVRDLED
jgi:beta-barrel assembly-enhancing protease